MSAKKQIEIGGGGPTEMPAYLDEWDEAQLVDPERGHVAANDEAPWSGEPRSAPQLRGRAEDLPKAQPWLERVTPCVSDWFVKAPPRRTWLLRDSRAQDVGVLPLGKVGLLTGEGGVSKTMAVCALAIAVASHEPHPWFGCFAVPDQGRVLLLLGEEEAEEAQRRLYNARRAVGAPIPEPGSIVVVPLAGIPVPMVESDQRGNAFDAAFLLWLRAFVAIDDGQQPFKLIVVDPLSRFAGKDAEIDNAMATRFVQALESVASASGATVLCVHHTNKTAPASAGRQAVRGSSAIYDGVRWAAALSAERLDLEDDEIGERLGELVTFSVVKSNYSRKSDPVTLRRDHENGGALVPLSQVDRERIAHARQAAAPGARRQAARDEQGRARLSTMGAAVVEVLRERSDGLPYRGLRAAIQARLGSCTDPALAAALESLGTTVQTRPGPNRATIHYLAEEMS